MKKYQINVAVKGFHYFRTEAAEMPEREAFVMLGVFKKVFPESQGYSLMLQCWTTTGAILKTIG